MGNITRTLCFLALVLVASVLPAHAGVLICKSSYTDSKDRERLHTAMQRAFPPGVRVEGIPDICRNPRHAYAWLSTWAQLRPDGVTEWWTVQCERERRDWACQAPEHRGLIWVYADIGGISRQLELSFEDGIDLDRARRVAVLAERIIHDPSSAPIPACGGAASQSEWEKKQRENALSATDTIVELDIRTDKAGGMHVITQGGAGLDLTFTDDGTAPPARNRPCWTEWIVVG